MIKSLKQKFITGRHDKHGDGYFQIYINPTKADFDFIQQEVRKFGKEQGQEVIKNHIDNMFRCGCDWDGNLYRFHAWCLHQQAARRLAEKNIRLPFRFSYTRFDNMIAGPHTKDYETIQKFKSMSEENKKLYWYKISKEISKDLNNASLKPIEQFMINRRGFKEAIIPTQHQVTVDPRYAQYDRMRQLRGVQ